MKTEAQIRVVLLYAKRYLEPWELEEARKEHPEGMWFCQHLDFRLWARNCMRIHSCCFKSPRLLRQPWETSASRFS